MRLSKIGMKNTKINKTTELHLAQRALLDSGQLYQFASGIFGLHNIPYKLKLNIENLVRKILNKYELCEISLPLIHPKEIWEKSGRFDKYIEEGVMLSTETNHGTLCLAPTAEEAIVEFAKNNLSSHKQLPTIYYQMNEKFRNEIRNRGYLFRGKTFSMFDAYSFDKDEAALNKSYLKMREAFLEIFKELSLPVIPVAADSGSIGGAKSEEFMLISPLGEDTILYNKEKNIALNTEILEKENYNEILKNIYGINSTDGFEKVKAIELGHIFQLGNIYSSKMEALFTDSDEKQKPFEMGCYGIGISRTVATIYEYNKTVENNKLVKLNLPITVTPYIAQIIYSIKNNEKEKEAEQLYSYFLDNDIPVILDDRKDKKISFGAKINESKILGSPITIILGDKVENGKCELEINKTNDKYEITIDKAKELIQNLHFDRNLDIKDFLLK